MNNSFNIYYVDLLPYDKKKKILNENLELSYNCDWKSMQLNNYKLTQLKNISKKNKIKGYSKLKKKDLRYKIINYLRLNFYVKKIQKIWKLFLRRKYNILKGPALINRKCVNSSDFLSLKDIKNIEYGQFFSYKDIDGFVYGFNIKSIYNLIKKQNNKKNPYNRYNINNGTINNLYKTIEISKFLNENADINIVFNNSIFSNKKKMEMRALTLFNKIDTFGWITNSKWFLELNNRKLIDYLKELIDLWNYRLHLSNQRKREIIPPHGNPFIGISLSQLTGELNNTYIKNKILDVINAFINKSNNIEMQKLGAMYILGCLTIISKNASDAFPVLYEQFRY